MGCCQWAVGVGWYQVIGCEWVLCSSVAFSTDPAVGCCVSHDLCSAFVCACVVWALWLGVRPVPFGCAGFAACAVGGEGSAGEAGLADWHYQLSVVA